MPDRQPIELEPGDRVVVLPQFGVLNDYYTPDTAYFNTIEEAEHLLNATKGPGKIVVRTMTTIVGPWEDAEEEMGD